MKTVLKELFDLKAIYKTDNGEYRVANDLYREYRDYFEDEQQGGTPSAIKVKKGTQTGIVGEFKAWLDLKKIPIIDNHVFLEGSRLDGLKSHLVDSVQTELLIVNPYVDKANTINDLRALAKKGVKIKILTRPPDNDDKKEVIESLFSDGIEIFTNKSIHAKIMVFDRGVSIISSMNLYAFSAGGGSWEAGIATSCGDIVSEVLNRINLKFDERESKGWGIQPLAGSSSPQIGKKQ